MIRWIFLLLFLGGLYFYTLQSLKTIGANRLVIQLYSLGLLGVYVHFGFHFFSYSRMSGLTPIMSIAAGLFMAVIVFQLLLVFVLLFEDVARLLQGVFGVVSNSTSEGFLPSRRKFISQLAIGLAALPFASLLVGMIRGKYNYKVLHYSLTFNDLPEAFDGFQLTQISDIHSGSFDNPDKVNYGIDLINKQQSDVILFTGDIVNNKASELLPWKDAFARLNAPLGVYSVLGNHDYGDYTPWPTTEAKKENLDQLFAHQRDMGFELLRNETRFIEKKGQRIALIGVENWGKGGFKKAGDLDKATTEVKDTDFKILLSHDPSHWEAKVLPHPFQFHLTLSGHTHGMQFGIEIPGWFKWSPVKWRYKQWAGLYEQSSQWINVNRGFGFLGYPGRVGIWPEITVITLKRSV